MKPLTQRGNLQKAEGIIEECALFSGCLGPTIPRRGRAYDAWNRDLGRQFGCLDAPVFGDGKYQKIGRCRIFAPTKLERVFEVAIQKSVGFVSESQRAR